MRVMIDTNIFISAVLFPNGKASAALKKALVSPYQPVTCDYVINELHRKFDEKFPERIFHNNRQFGFDNTDALTCILINIGKPIGADRKVRVHRQALGTGAIFIGANGLIW